MILSGAEIAGDRLRGARVRHRLLVERAPYHHIRSRAGQPRADQYRARRSQEPWTPCAVSASIEDGAPGWRLTTYDDDPVNYSCDRGV